MAEAGANEPSTGSGPTVRRQPCGKAPEPRSDGMARQYLDASGGTPEARLGAIRAGHPWPRDGMVRPVGRPEQVGAAATRPSSGRPGGRCEEAAGATVERVPGMA
jgi:hypothetical protein